MRAATAVDPATVTAAILAGGAGTRLSGRDKGLAVLNGKPLIEHVLAAIQPQAGSVLICANRNAAQYAEYGRVLPDAAVGFRGPLAGIAAALAECRTAWLLTVPVDCPTPPRDLAARLAASANDASVAVAHDGVRTQPLFALYRRGLADAARSALQSDSPVWRWQQQAGAAVGDFADCAAAFGNLNTAEDFLRWESEHG